MVERKSAAPRRYEALAYLVHRLGRGEACPSYEDFARHLRCGKSFAKRLVNQLVAEGVVGKQPGATRALYIIDVTHARELLVAHLHTMGASVAQPVGPMLWGSPDGHLPMMPMFRHLPDP